MKEVGGWLKLLLIAVLFMILATLYFSQKSPAPVKSRALVNVEQHA